MMTQNRKTGHRRGLEAYLAALLLLLLGTSAFAAKKGGSCTSENPVVTVEFVAADSGLGILPVGNDPYGNAVINLCSGSTDMTMNYLTGRNARKLNISLHNPLYDPGTSSAITPQGEFSPFLNVRRLLHDTLPGTGGETGIFGTIPEADDLAGRPGWNDTAGEYRFSTILNLRLDGGKGAGASYQVQFRNTDADTYSVLYPGGDTATNVANAPVSCGPGCATSMVEVVYTPSDKTWVVTPIAKAHPYSNGDVPVGAVVDNNGVLVGQYAIPFKIIIRSVQ